MSHVSKHFKDSPDEAKRQLDQRIATLKFNLEVAVKTNSPVEVESVREELVSLLTLDNTVKVDLGLPETSSLFKSRDMTKIILDTPYLSLQDILIYIPRGMKVSYVKAGIVLNDLATTLTEVDEVVLTPLVNYVAGLVERPEGLERPFPYRTTLDFKDLTKKLNQAFDIPSEKVQAKYSKVIERNKDWHDASVLNESLQAALSPDRLKRLMDKHDRIRELSKTLDKTLEAHNADLTNSAKTITQFIEYTEYAAKLLTFYGHVNAIAISYNVALNDNVTRLREISS